MTVNLSPAQVVAVLGVLLALVMVWRSGTRRGRRAADAAHMASRVASLAGYVLGAAGVIVAVQWIAITYAPGKPSNASKPSGARGSPCASTPPPG